MTALPTAATPVQVGAAVVGAAGQLVTVVRSRGLERTRGHKADAAAGGDLPARSTR